MTKGQHKKTTNFRFKGIEWLFMNLPFVCYLALLGIVYIYSAHSVEGNLREIEALKNEVNDTRWRYMEIKQEIMYGSTQSQIEKKVADLNLKPIRTVPIKITDSK
ncbi:MAG: FtsL-like putative cell division protein [Bacteroidota bacterium]